MSTTPTTTVTNAVADLDTELLTVAGAGIAVGAVVFAVRKGWRIVKGMI